MTTIDTTERVKAYLSSHEQRLSLVEQMWNDKMVRCYNDEALPTKSELALGSVFLAGPTSRHQLLEYNWRAELISLLRLGGFRGIIYIPEPRGLEVMSDFTERGYIHRWESLRLLTCRYPVFWVPRKADELLGLNTNLELGIILGLILAGKLYPEDVFVGWPPEAERMGLPNHYATELAQCKRHKTESELVRAIVERSFFHSAPVSD